MSLALLFLLRNVGPYLRTLQVRPGSGPGDAVFAISRSHGVSGDPLSFLADFGRSSCGGNSPLVLTAPLVLAAAPFWTTHQNF
jgi:hypothetical protein